ncbi:LysR family transcriptional regulator [Caulobacter sp. ErkDOM-YI]|uniref:LysR family transcriptional regulator n=1 Tax=unclassified Caulobacter TaxID=2648921 RepID=UPI003AF55C87
MARLQAMQVFVKVAESGGFAEAARQLNMSPPAVTRAVALLEEGLGARLFTRTTRVVRLTEVGQRYFDDCQKILSYIEEADAVASGAYSEAKGSLTVTASVLFGQMYVMPILQEYLEQNSQVVGKSLFLDRVTNLVEEGVDVALRIGHLSDSGLAAIRVGQVRRVICGSPKYFEQHGAPSVPQDLAGHRIVAATSAWTNLEWRFGRERKVSTMVEPRLFCNSNQAVIDAARSGWGLTRILSYQIGAELRDGDLQIVLADYEEEPLPIHVVHPEGRRASAKVRAFVDLAVDRLRANRLLN